MGSPRPFAGNPSLRCGPWAFGPVRAIPAGSTPLSTIPAPSNPGKPSASPQKAA